MIGCLKNKSNKLLLQQHRVCLPQKPSQFEHQLNIRHNSPCQVHFYSPVVVLDDWLLEDVVITLYCHNSQTMSTNL